MQDTLELPQIQETLALPNTQRRVVAHAAALPADAAGLIQTDLKRWHVGAWLALLAIDVAAAWLDGRLAFLHWNVTTAPPVANSSMVLLLLALGCEFMDATIGMGYGTTLTPILIILGYPVAYVVPAALVSQFIANLSAAFFHHKAGNFNFWKDHQTRNTALVMGGIGLVVSIAATQLAVKLPAHVLRSAITLMVLGIGVFMLVGSQLKIRFRMRNVGVLAGVAAFNKAFTGGGYGPLVCGGQVLVGLPIRAAIASTAMAEAIVCLAAVITYLASGRTIPLFLIVPLVIGALLSTPVSAITLRRLPQVLVKRLMALAIIVLGAYALWQGKGI